MDRCLSKKVNFGRIYKNIVAFLCKAAEIAGAKRWMEGMGRKVKQGRWVGWSLARGLRSGEICKACKAGRTKQGLEYSRHAHRLRKRGELAVSSRQGLKYLRTYVQNMGEGI